MSDQSNPGSRYLGKQGFPSQSTSRQSHKSSPKRLNCASCEIRLAEYIRGVVHYLVKIVPMTQIPGDPVYLYQTSSPGQKIKNELVPFVRHYAYIYTQKGYCDCEILSKWT